MGDFNGDGDPDLAVANLQSDYVAVLVAAPARRSRPRPSTPRQRSPSGHRGRLQRRRRPRPGRREREHRRRLDPARRRRRELLGAERLRRGDAPRALAAADFTRDGDLDLVVANTQSDNVSVLVGGPGGSFSEPLQLGAGTVPSRWRRATSTATGSRTSSSRTAAPTTCRACSTRHRRRPPSRPAGGATNTRPRRSGSARTSRHAASSAGSTPRRSRVSGPDVHDGGAADGPRVIEARATDPAGNVDPTPAQSRRHRSTPTAPTRRSTRRRRSSRATRSRPSPSRPARPGRASSAGSTDRRLRPAWRRSARPCCRTADTSSRSGQSIRPAMPTRRPQHGPSRSTRLRPRPRSCPVPPAHHAPRPAFGSRRARRARRSSAASTRLSFAPLRVRPPFTARAARPPSTPLRDSGDRPHRTSIPRRALLSFTALLESTRHHARLADRSAPRRRRPRRGRPQAPRRPPLSRSRLVDRTIISRTDGNARMPSGRSNGTSLRRAPSWNRYDHTPRDRKLGRFIIRSSAIPELTGPVPRAAVERSRLKGSPQPCSSGAIVSPASFRELPVELGRLLLPRPDDRLALAVDQVGDRVALGDRDARDVARQRVRHVVERVVVVVADDHAPVTAEVRVGTRGAG